jgi:phosphoglycolate phosphatase-like HAD superfamily hydrolase
LRPAIKAIVLDFDGTFTDVEVEGAPFVRTYRAALSDLVGRDVSADWERAAAEIAARPGRYGWVHGGRIVAPGNADPYVRCTAVAQLICDAENRLRDPEVRTAVVQAFYQLAYRHTVTAFRPEARETLGKLTETGLPVYVVTNSSTQVVTQKLRELAPPGLERLHVLGDAQKFVVAEATDDDPRFDDVPAERRLDGLERPVYPRRGRYFDALARIWRETGAAPAETLVCGDIFELDLSLPIELGLQVHLVTGPATAPYERAAVAALGARGSAGERVSDVLARL